MAPRKKRAVKNAALTARTRSGIKYPVPISLDLKKTAAKKLPDIKKPKELTPIPKPVEPMVTRSHKKFGKYRFFAENKPLEQHVTNSSKEDTHHASNSIKNEIVHSIEEVLLPGPDLEMENEDNVDILESDDYSEDGQSVTESFSVEKAVPSEENCSSISDVNIEESENTEMDCTIDPEMTITQQLLKLNVDSDQRSIDLSQGNCEVTVQYVTESEKEDSQEIYHIETFESEVVIDCFSEDVIPICGEQEIENGNEELSNSQDNSEKETIFKGDEVTLKEELTAILEDPKSENEDLIKEKKTESSVSEIAITPEVINQESNDANLIVKGSDEDVMQQLAEIIGCSKLTDVKVVEKISTPTNRNLDKAEEVPPNIEDTKKEATKGKPKPKISKKKSEKCEKEGETPNKPSESSVRRSNRIKSISVLKQRSTKGHGLVKQKGERNVECELSDSNTLTFTDPQSNKTQQSINHTGQSSAISVDQKPVKVKSRWRRSSELELSTAPSSSQTKIPAPLTSAPVSDTNASVVTEEEAKRKDAEEVTKRLKQFVHLKENLYLTERISCKEAKKMICDCFMTEEDIEQGEYGCGEDCLNRLLMIECGSLCAVGDRCTNKRFQKGQFAPCEVFRTEKKGLGIRAAANIPYGEFILEYVGEVLDPEEFEKRAAEYSKDKNQHYYFMSLRADAVIDATRKGNVSRFINHSCDPNAETQKWTVNGELRIGFFSKRTILAGEEVTFDYQFQRYGKEAQKCYCEAPTCRGWLGEEPDDEDDEDEDDDEDEEEEDDEEEDSNRKAVAQDITKDIAEIATSLEKADIQEKPDGSQKVTATPKTEKPVKKEKKKTLRQRLPRKELFEDLDLDEEIETLQTTGLKNQAHTLKLSRLMVRAKEPPQRTKLLRVLRRGELPCRRLFLDYHGLRLIHGWMTDAQHLSRINKKLESLRLEILQTLATLPIPNKTMLQDSKVLPTVEKWSVKLEEEISTLDSDSNSPKLETEADSRRPHTSSSVSVKVEPRVEIEKRVSGEAFPADMDISPVAFEEKEPEKVKGVRVPPPPSTSSNLSVDDYETEIIALALKLLEEWSVLKEVYRIPKKERIEQMKEHEREADRKYKAGLDGQDPFEKRDLSRYYLESRRQKKRRKSSHADKDSSSPMDKYERRKLFAIQVEQREMDRRRHQREIWQQHEQRCVVMGADPRFTAPFDPSQGYQCVWNPQTGQWQNYSMPGANQSFTQHHLHQSSQQQQQQPTMISMLPQMQQNPAMMKQMLVQKAPMNFNPQPPPPPLPTSHLPTSAQHQYVGRPPPSAVNVAASHIVNMTAVTVTPSHHQHRVMPYPPQTYHLPVDSQNPNMTNLSMSNVHQGKLPPPLPALPYQENLKEQEEVKFMGPIPPPAKLPPKWKCAKDKYGRPYYYHIRIRKAQWEPPELPPEENDEASDLTSSSDTSSATSESSSEETDSDEDIDDAKLLLQIKNKFKQMDAIKNTEKCAVETKEIAVDEDGDSLETKERSLDDRLIEEFCFMKGNTNQAKRKRVGLVQEILISPRTEEDRLQFKEDMKRYKQNKEKLKRQKELLLEQSKKHASPKPSSKSSSSISKQEKGSSKKHKISVKTKLKEMGDSENTKKIKELFRSSMAVVMVSILNTYRKPDCREGRITNTEDFKHLARKLTHFVMLKELKHCQNIEDLTCTESVKSKAKEFVRKYMSKFGEIYQKPKDEADFY